MIDIFNAIPNQAQGISDTVNNAAGKGMTSMSEAQSFLNDNISNLVTPQEMKGINGWLFDVKKTEQIDNEADITDHYMEDNTVINDHVVRKPIRITLSGYIGELVARKSDISNAIPSYLSSSLSTISAYTGEYTSGTIQKMQEVISQSQSYANTVNQAIDKTKDIVKQFKSFPDPAETAIKAAYNSLYAFFLSEDLLTVQTPFGLEDNMKIEKLSMSVPEDSESYTDISITLKKMRFGEIGYAKFDNKLLENRNIMQSTKNKDEGKKNGKLVSVVKAVYNAKVQGN
jgi:hypothetical protein